MNRLPTHVPAEGRYIGPTLIQAESSLPPPLSPSPLLLLLVDPIDADTWSSSLRSPHLRIDPTGQPQHTRPMTETGGKWYNFGGRAAEEPPAQANRFPSLPNVNIPGFRREQVGQAGRG